MNSQELQERFEYLYDEMKDSRKVENMKLFGSVMKEMMAYAIQRYPSEAQNWIDELGAIEWKNYLTPDEAEKIVSEMDGAPWSRDVWNRAMDSYGLDKEDKPCYNPCSLWVTMNKSYVDHSDSIARIMSTPIEDIPTETMVTAVYLLATDRLKNDINIRHQYGL